MMLGRIGSIWFDIFGILFLIGCWIIALPLYAIQYSVVIPIKWVVNKLMEAFSREG